MATVLPRPAGEPSTAPGPRAGTRERPGSAPGCSRARRGHEPTRLRAMSNAENSPTSNGRCSDTWYRSWTHLRVERRSPSYCRVTFDHPPINTITATTVAELAELVGLIEEDPDLNVVVFDSANPDFYLAHYDVENDPARTAALGVGPTGHAGVDRRARPSGTRAGGQHRLDPGTRPRRRKRVRARVRPAVRLAREHAARPVRGRHRRGPGRRSDGQALPPGRPRPGARGPARRRRLRRTARGAVRVRQPGDRRRPARRRGRRRSPHGWRASTTTRSRAPSPTSTG